MEAIDFFLNRVTMYRLMLYYLIGLFITALLLSAFRIFAFTPLSLGVTTAVFFISSWITNTIFAKIFNAQTNIESVYITSFILALIVTPVTSLFPLINVAFIGLFSVASKYIVTINRKHVFNPAAFGVWSIGLLLHQNASWWVGTEWMLPFVCIGGFLMIRKMKRGNLIVSFLIVSFLTIIGFSFIAGQSNIIILIKKTALETPIFFFAFVMLTEPLTTPPFIRNQRLYAMITGVLFAPQFHVFSYYFSPEESLLVGNVFSYLISPKAKLFLHLKEQIHVSSEIYDFIFPMPQNFSYSPGQYMEWTLAHPHEDDRGSRRYLTLASSPTEDTLRIGIRFSSSPSSFKKHLLTLSGKQEIIASQLAGEFILPEDKSQKLVFLAGGIGITPFRSIIKFLLDTKQKRDITVFYSAKNPKEFAYTDVFKEAVSNLGVKIIYTITDLNNIPSNWKGEKGRITETMIKDAVPDFKERIYYLSGPQSMILSFEKILRALDIPKNHVKQDYFPGFT